MDFLKMSFSGAVLIAAVVIIRAAAINKLPKKTFLILWELVLLRLLVPFSVPSVLSVYTLIPAFFKTDTGNAVPAVPQGQFKTIQLPLPVNTTHSVSVYFIIWCIGAVFCAVLFTVFYLRCLTEFRMSCPVQNDYVERWLKENPLKRPLSVRQSDRIPAPLTYGIFRPVILMPSKTDWKNEKQLQYILLHEYVHIRRFDTVIKLISVSALCVHWFNPMVWVMYLLFNRDIELSCDESVIRKLGENSKSAYAKMLIEMEAEKSGLTPLCSNFSKNAIEERITAIMKTKKATVITMITACFIILGIAGVFATSADATAENKETAFDGNHVSSEDYAIYQPFGLTVENGKLYYDGQLVRCFDDQIPQKNLSVKAIGYYEDHGTVDVRTVRENTNGVSELTGLEAASQEEFQNKVIVDHSYRSPAKTDETMFGAYESYGLSYDESENALFYDGERVRLFWDSRSSEAQPDENEKWFLDSISYWDAEGVIDLYAVRDFDRTDENGYGKFTGFRIATKEEFETDTEVFSNQNPAVETAE